MNNEGKYLVLNAGSSSLKFSLFSMPDEQLLVKGNIEKIGEDKSIWKISNEEYTISSGEMKINNHKEAVTLMLDQLFLNRIITNVDEIKGIGHRILHGGEKYSDSALINEEVINDIIGLTNLGPLHHPGELAGIRAMLEFFPETPMVAVFDTAFHQTIDPTHFMYPVPYEWYTKYGVRKYGFHGTSYKYITNKMKEKLGKEDTNLIICHIGSGASIAAIKDGKCFNTTMGLTPLDGLMMGTRCGDIDASLVTFMKENAKKTEDQVMDELNKKSGFLGIVGKNDFRDVSALAEQGNKKAILAIEMFKNSIVKFIAEYYMDLDGDIDAIVFTAGVGENANNIRKLVIDKISRTTGIVLDEEKNNAIASFKDIHEGVITKDNSTVPVYVVPTNEELMIVKDTYNIVNKKQKVMVIK